jgi:DNA-binding NtrC family response regulator
MQNAAPKESDIPSLLIASADVPYATALTKHLAVDGYNLERCHDAQGVLRRVGRTEFDVVLMDQDLIEEGDVNLVSYIQRQSPVTRIILLFGPDQVDRAMEGIRLGAHFYLPKSCELGDVAMVAAKAVRSLETERSIQHFEQQAFEEMLGSTTAMKRVIEVITKVAPTDSTALLLGESGTGKDLLANTIHRLSPRRDRPLVAVNCAALPEGLLESELFGHVRGAFTGAEADKRGLFEEADGGTIFLDEIGDMALVTQAKLLRVLQNGEFRRVGDSETRRVHVRIIAATNKDLEELVRDKGFREDLYFRLNVVQIRIPPLRERLDALPKLVQFFVARAGSQFDKRIDDLDEAAQVLLQGYPYPGNVRELESIIQHAVIMAEGGVIRARDLPEAVQEGRPRLLALPDRASETFPTLEAMEEQHIREALDRWSGNQTEVARRLGISRSTLWRKLKEYGVSAK